VVRVVLCAVDLDSQSLFRTKEVEYKWPELMLPAKLDPKLAASHQLPNDRFRVSLRTAQFSATLSQCRKNRAASIGGPVAHAVRIPSP